MSVRRVTSAAIAARKGAPFPVITAYDAPFGRLAEEAGIDVLLCGDSLGMVVLGYPSTSSVDLEDMKRHTSAVARGTKTAHLIADLPFGAFEASGELAIASSVELVRCGASSVKIEGGARNAERIAAVTGAGIPVCAHVGVLPQTANLDSGFRRKKDRDALFADVASVIDAGAFAVVLEMVDFEIAREITARFTLPTIGIGAGPHCDAQVLVLHDALGLYGDSPPFAKRFAEIGAAVRSGLSTYAADVRSGAFPLVAPASANGEATVYGAGRTGA